MKKYLFFLLIMMIIGVSGCASAGQQISAPILNVEYSASEAPWAADLIHCALENQISLHPIPSLGRNLPDEADALSIHVGNDPQGRYEYQIGIEEIQVIVNVSNTSGMMDGSIIKYIFTGEIENWQSINGNDAHIQVWIFPEGDEIQKAFEYLYLDNLPVNTSARVAFTPDEMSIAISNDINAIGIITKRWKAGNTRTAATQRSIPVLAVFPEAPDIIESKLILCMQNMP